MNDEGVRLEASIPANNSKIIELYNKMRAGQISINSDYQRKLVWKKQHKFDFIDTILRNYPFPEIYLAPGSLDQEKLILVDEIVDGQQRLTTIRDYINGVDVFSLPKLPIARFSELSAPEKTSFLNYEVSIRYLKSVSQTQIRDIFQRINKTDYALNTTERLNAQWGESEFICFCKQIVEPEFDSEAVQYIIDPANRSIFLSFFHGEDDDESIFSPTDRTRMIAVQYMMTVIATMDFGEYFARNERVAYYIKSFNDAFPQAGGLENRLVRVVQFIQKLRLERTSRWFNKANLLTLLVELDKAEVEEIDPEMLSELLSQLNQRWMLDEVGLNESSPLSIQEVVYIGYAREAVNQKAAREFRGEFVRGLFQQAAKPRTES
jgi:hypothetical protein